MYEYDTTNQEMSSTSGMTHWTKVTEHPIFKLCSASNQWRVLFVDVACRQVVAVYPWRTLQQYNIGALKLGRGINIDYSLVYTPHIDL